MAKSIAAGRHSWYAVSLLSAGHFFSDFYANFLPALLPLVMTKLGLSLTMSGLLIMALSFSSNVLQPYFGYMIDKKNLNWLLLLTVPCSAVFICYIGLVNSTFMLFMFVTLSGMAVSLFHPLGSSLLNRVSAPQKLGLSISVFVAGGNVGFALAPAIIVYFTEIYGMSALPILILPGLLLSLFYYQSKLYRPQLKVLNKDATLPKLLKQCCQSDLIKLNIAMGLRAWTQVAMTTFLTVLLVTRGYSATFAGIMLTVFLSGAAIGGLTGGYLSDRYGVKNVLVCSLAFGILPTYFFLSSTELTLFTGVMLFLSGAGLQGSAPSSLIWAQRLLPNNAGMASGMMLGLSFGLGGIGAAVTGILGDYVTLSTALLWTTFAVPLATVVSMTIPGSSAPRAKSAAMK